MASIHTTKEEFVDIILALLLDKILHPDEMINSNEDFNDMIDLMSRRGLKPLLLHYYMGTKAKSRSKWKHLRKNFLAGKSSSGSINMSAGKEDDQDTEDEPIKENINNVKDLVKKSIKSINYHRQRSNFPLSEDKIDKIIDKVLINEGIIKEKK